MDVEHVRLCFATDSNGQTILMTTSGEVVDGITRVDVRLEPHGATATIDVSDFVINAVMVSPEDINAAVEGLKGIEDDLADRS